MLSDSVFVEPGKKLKDPSLPPDDAEGKPFPKQNRAVGLFEGVWIPPISQKSKYGKIATSQETLGHVIKFPEGWIYSVHGLSLNLNAEIRDGVVDLEKPHWWKVYPRTKRSGHGPQKEQWLSVQLQAIWTPDRIPKEFMDSGLSSVCSIIGQVKSPTDNGVIISVFSLQKGRGRNARPRKVIFEIYVLTPGVSREKKSCDFQKGSLVSLSCKLGQTSPEMLEYRIIKPPDIRSEYRPISARRSVPTKVRNWPG